MKRWMTLGSIALFAAGTMILPGCAEEDTNLPPAENLPSAADPVTPAPSATDTATDPDAATTQPADDGM